MLNLLGIYSDNNSNNASSSVNQLKVQEIVNEFTLDAETIIDDNSVILLEDNGYIITIYIAKSNSKYFKDYADNLEGNSFKIETFNTTKKLGRIAQVNAIDYQFEFIKIDLAPEILTTDFDVDDLFSLDFDFVNNNVNESESGETATSNITLTNVIGKIYGDTTDLTGDITVDETDAVLLGKALLYHNDSTTPNITGITTDIIELGGYVTGVRNIILITKTGTNKTTIIYSQEEIPIEYYLFFDVDNYITVPHDTSINFDNTDAFAFEFKLNRGSYTGALHAVVINKQGSSPSFRGYEVKCFPATGILQFAIISDNASTNLIAVRSTNAIPLNTWTKIHVSYDGSQLASGVKIWFNGVLETNNVLQDNLSSTTVIPAQPIYIGRDAANNNRFQEANLDSLKIYNQALTQSNVDNNDVTPIHFYKMEEVNIVDSISALNGTATGMTNADNVKVR